MYGLQLNHAGEIGISYGTIIYLSELEQGEKKAI